MRNAARIRHADDETGKVRSNDLHDFRAACATRLMTESDLTNEEIVDVIA